MIGARFNKWKVIDKTSRTDKKYHRFWVCECDCKNIGIVREDNLKNGTSTQCLKCAVSGRGRR